MSSVAVVAEPVDPCNPEQWREMQQQDRMQLSRWLPVRIRQLEDERAELLETISRLPLHAPKPLSDQMGFHSMPQEAGSSEGVSSSQVSIEFEFDPGLGAIALAPSLIPGEEGSYSFPRRFKIEVIERNARWIGDSAGEYYIPPPPYEWMEVVSWMDQDFPDPGPYPVFFSVGDLWVNQVRLTVASSSADAPYHALGEMYLFRRPEQMDRLGDNMMTWDSVTLSASNSLSKPPLWSEAYLRDGIAALGMPLSEKVSGAEDFMVSWDEDVREEEPVQIVLDLGQLQAIGRVQLWPAEAPLGMAIPHFGFPGKVHVELSTQSDFREAFSFSATQLREHFSQDNLLNIITKGTQARYIRITVEELPTYKGRRILGLGEIRVSEFDEVWSLNSAVSAVGIPPAGLEQLPRLVDGFSRNRRILREVEWIRGLALRRPLDRRLFVVEQELALAKGAWADLKLKASIWGGGFICFALLGAMGLQRMQRRRILKKLKTRITRDLHDEVGSNLGSITLAARRMEKAGASAADLADLSLMTREASASLKDVVWVIDQTTIHLPMLLQKLAERAERVLGDVELHLELSPDCPDRVVPLTFKRHLVMFFKEAVHNCARHANATEVWMKLSADSEQLEVVLKDNGCGFNTAETGDGWGVDSMYKRAQELGGKMTLDSSPGAGTSVCLTVPLNVLSRKTDHQYKTSN